MALPAVWSDIPECEHNLFTSPVLGFCIKGLAYTPIHGLGTSPIYSTKFVATLFILGHLEVFSKSLFKGLPKY